MLTLTRSNAGAGKKATEMQYVPINTKGADPDVDPSPNLSLGRSLVLVRISLLSPHKDSPRSDSLTLIATPQQGKVTL